MLSPWGLYLLLGPSQISRLPPVLQVPAQILSSQRKRPGAEAPDPASLDTGHSPPLAIPCSCLSSISALKFHKSRVSVCKLLSPPHPPCLGEGLAQGRHSLTIRQLNE